MGRLALMAGVIALAGGLAASAWARPQERECGMCPMGGGMEKMPHGGSRGMGPMAGMHGLAGQAEELGLTEEQFQKIRELAEDWAKKRIDLVASQQKARLALGKALRAEEVDMEEVEKGLDAVLQAQKDLQLGQIRHMADAREVLTDEQQEKIGRGPMGCLMMGGHHDQQVRRPRGMHHGHGMRGGRGCPMMGKPHGGPMEDAVGVHHGRRTRPEMQRHEGTGGHHGGQ